MKKKCVIVFFTMLFLQGCLPAVFVVGAATGGLIIFDQRSAKTMLQDRDITSHLQTKLDHKLGSRAHISITVFNRIALLVGQAPNAKLRDHADRVAKSVTKIKMLYNEVAVAKPISKMARANDAWITAKVKTMLVSVPGLRSSTLKVVTENSVVYLMGLTARSQAKLAARKVRTVAGVKKVVKLFEYTN